MTTPSMSRSVGPMVSCQPATHTWSLLECAAPGRPWQCGTAVFLGLCLHKLSKRSPQDSISGANNTGLSVWRDNRRHHRHALLVFTTNGADAVSSFVMPADDATFDEQVLEED